MSNTAADRVEAFLDRRTEMLGLDPNDIIGANDAHLTVDDLRELVKQARKVSEPEPQRPAPSHVGVNDDTYDCALELTVRDYGDFENSRRIRIAVEDIPGFMAQVVQHGGYALSTAARRLEVGNCPTCKNVGLVYEDRNGRPWSVECPDCRPRWPERPFQNAPHIG